MSDVHLRYLDEVSIQVKSERGIIQELAEAFTFKAENYKFSPKFKMGMWDGNISLINRNTGVVNAGLAQRIKKFCDDRDYSFSFDEQLTYDNVSEHELREFIVGLNIPSRFEIREYQFDAVLKCLRSRRRTLLSPTSSGKSLMIYILTQWYSKRNKTKSLIIVPTIGLVKQMDSDFREYGYNGDSSLSIGGLDKSNDIHEPLVITTWQSLDNGKSSVSKQWYKQFDVVVGDEAHGAKATTLIKILSSMTSTRYRFGTTGTLDNSKLNQMTIEGLFGPQYKTTTTRELIDAGHASDIKIKCIVLKYPEEVAKEFHRSQAAKKAINSKTNLYHEEIDFLVNYQPRNDFIKNLTMSLKGNKLVFFRLTDHGEIIYNSLSDNENVFYIDGSVDGSEREDIRQAIETESNAILVASLGTTSTGVSIKKLHHMIAASPSKGKIKVLQSIGRMLRQHDDKTHAVLYDIVDDLRYKSKKNYTLDHFEERSKIYDHEQFEYIIYNVRLK